MATETEIKEAEQEILATEERYRATVKNLLALPEARADKGYPTLGELDGVPVVGVAKIWPGKNEPDETDHRFDLDGQRYLRIAEAIFLDLPERLQSIHRSTVLHQKGLGHVFGVNSRLGATVGVYAKAEQEEEAVRAHVALLSESYPTLAVSLEQLRRLNVAPEFVYLIESQPKLTVPGLNLGKVATKFFPVYYRNPSVAHWNPGLAPDYPASVLELSSNCISTLLKPPENYHDWDEETMQSLTEYIKNLLQKNAYEVNCRPFNSDVEIYFDRILSYNQIGEVLELLGGSKTEHYLTLYRLSERLRRLVNLPLENATLSPLVQSEINYDFQRGLKFGKRPQDAIYLSLTMF